MTRHTTVRAAVFDLDGLLVNTEQLYPAAARELLARRDREFTPELHQQMMGRQAKIALALLKEAHGLPETVEALMDESGEIFRAMLDEQLELMPGVEALLARIEAAQLPKAVATSSGRVFAEDILSRLQLLDRFEFLLCAEDVTNGKPHPEIYLTAASRLSVNPSEMLVFEDSVNGFKAAMASGAIVVAVPGEHNLGQTYPDAHFMLETLIDAPLDHLWPK